MYQNSKLAIITLSTLVGFIFIFNLYFLINVSQSIFIYLTLALLAILTSWSIPHLWKTVQQIEGEHLIDKNNNEKFNQQQMPRICKLEDETVLPPLDSEQLYIMQQLFPGNYRVRVQPLEGGYNNFGVFYIILETAENRLLRPGFFVKFLRQKDVVEEIHAHQTILYEYPLAFTPGRPIKSWPPDQQLRSGNSLGGVCYELAALNPNSQLQTLKNLYKQLSFEEFAPYLHLLFERLERWYGLRLPETVAPNLGGPNGVYNRLYRRRNDLQRKIFELVKDNAHTSSTSSSNFQDLDATTWLKLPFLPEGWTDEEFYNPIIWINNVLVPGDARFFRAISRYSPVHGDLHTGNIIVEKAQDVRVWLIDFANAHLGPSIQDFASMEADVKFNLIDMKLCSLDDWLRFEQQLLVPLKNPIYRLNWPWSQGWQPEGELLKAWKFIEIIRRWVIEYELIGNDVRAYYLALLHATLPVLYRDNHNEIQKQCALISSAWMCKYLS